MTTKVYPICLFFIGLAVITSQMQQAPVAVRESEQLDRAQSERAEKIRTVNPSSAPGDAPGFIEEGARAPASLPAEAQEFNEIKRKALPSQEDLREMKRLRRDPRALRAVFEILADADASSEVRRDLIPFAQEALMDKENPERAYVATQIEGLILADNLRIEHGQARRAELAADKGELVLTYLDAYPARLEFLLNASAGSPNIKVIHNALAIGERRRAESLLIIGELER